MADHKAIDAIRSINAEEALNARILRAGVLNLLTLKKEQIRSSVWTARDVQALDVIESTLKQVLPHEQVHAEQIQRVHPQTPLSGDEILKGIVGEAA